MIKVVYFTMNLILFKICQCCKFNICFLFHSLDINMEHIRNKTIMVKLKQLMKEMLII